MPDGRRLDSDDSGKLSDEVRQVTGDLRDALRAFQRALDAFDEAVANRLHINRTDLRCLDMLNDRGRLSAGDLARGCNLTSGAMSLVLDRLERGAFVRREHDSVDRRRVFVELEPEADQRAWALHEPMVRDARATFQAFRPGELRTVVKFLRAAHDLYDRHSEQLRITSPSSP